jgi:hypothetical protein
MDPVGEMMAEIRVVHEKVSERRWIGVDLREKQGEEDERVVDFDEVDGLGNIEEVVRLVGN